jgi:hypothetical protein
VGELKRKALHGPGLTPRGFLISENALGCPTTHFSEVEAVWTPGETRSPCHGCALNAFAQPLNEPDLQNGWQYPQLLTLNFPDEFQEFHKLHIPGGLAPAPLFHIVPICSTVSTRLHQIPNSSTAKSGKVVPEPVGPICNVPAAALCMELAKTAAPISTLSK